MEKEQAKLLQVGDIIRTKSGINSVLHIDFEDDVFHSISLKDDPLSYNARVLEQIPLTSEILEKNGFIDTEKISKIGFADFKVYQNKSIFDISERNNLFYYHSVTFETVDKLQRFLRLKGYVDFANNFKV